jgi:putative nucleotidyltransferase with HDIG domain
MITIEDLKKRVRELPPLPDVALRLLQMSRDPDVAPRDIVEVIKLDASITVQVLHLCNSPFYGLPRKVYSLQEAMVYIGTDALVNLVLAGCLSATYERENEGYGLMKRDMWRHGLACGICTQLVARKLNDNSLIGPAFTAGLLHDIGKIILNTYVGDEFKKIVEIVEAEHVSFLEAEQGVLGFTHAHCGAEVAEFWNLPEELVAAIRYHHAPSDADQYQRIVAMTHIGNILAISFGVGIGVDGLAAELDVNAVESLGIHRNDLFDLAIDFHDAFKKSEDLIDISQT